MNSPDYKTRVHVDGLFEIQRTINNSYNLLFLGIIIAALILASSQIYANSKNVENLWLIGSFPGLSLMGFILAGLLSIIAFINYLKKS